MALRFMTSSRAATVLVAVSASNTLLAHIAHAQSAVYEGWDYPAGAASNISPAGGTGWSPDSGYSQPLAIAPAGLSHPSALPGVGNALQTSADVPTIDISRPLNSSLDSTQTTWMSFLGRRDAEDAEYNVALQQISGNRTFSALFGIEPDGTLEGTLRYQADWQNVGFSVMGGSSFPARPLSSVGVTDLFLIRINPVDVDGGTQTFDLWVNPSPASLGSPDASVVWPSAIRIWNLVHFSATDATIDEFRIDSDLANVINLPTPGTGLFAVGITFLAAGARRRGPK